MSLIRYESHNFTPKTLATINQANEILEDYDSRGFDLTLHLNTRWALLPYMKDISTISALFWGRINKLDGDTCWEWLGYRTKDGYGLLQARKIHPQPLLTHRVAWMLSHGPIPPKMHVLHRCDNPPCCNPNHLFLGTQRDNNIDRDQKGRVASGDQNGSRTRPDRRAMGEQHGQSYLKLEQVLEIRRKYAEGGITQSKLAKEFGTNQQRISCIVNKKTWKDPEA